MTETVRELAIDKVNNIRQKIGYPDIITNAEELQQYYSNVSVHADTFFENRLSATKNDIRGSWAQLGQPVDRDEWDMSAPTVNAYYNPPGNEIVFPAGIMQAPVFYDPSVPKYISYGAFGAVAGHELSHAFDSTGRHYDQNGNYTDWWDESTVDGFASRAECFVQQYHNYTIPGGLPINGKLTLGENIADAGGLTAAFQAWRQRDDEKPDQQLPGLEEFGKEQVFFIAYGMTWCGKIRSEEAIRRVYTDPHSPSAFRILVSRWMLRAFVQVSSADTWARARLQTRGNSARPSTAPSKSRPASSGKVQGGLGHCRKSKKVFASVCPRLPAQRSPECHWRVPVTFLLRCFADSMPRLSDV